MNTYFHRSTALFFLLGALLIPNLAFAQDVFPWTVLFHLKEMNGTLSIDTESRFQYEPIPGRYGVDTKAIDPATAPYYGEFQDKKGTNLLRFGVEIPNTIVAGKNYTAVEVWAPLRGDAVKAVFFTKDGKRLFEISTKSTLICNQNGACDADYGENGYNCPLECPIPEDVTETQVTTDPIPDNLIPNTENISPATPSVPSAPAPVVSTSRSDSPDKTAAIHPGIFYGAFILLGGGLLAFIIRAFLKYRRGGDAPPLE